MNSFPFFPPVPICPPSGKPFESLMKCESLGVYRRSKRVECVGEKDLYYLKRIALKRGLGRSRLCVHPGDHSLLQEMFIVHQKGVYVRPHSHPNKSESYHVIEGQADAVFFDRHGHLTAVIPLGDPSSGRHFYCRIGESQFHTLLIRSKYFIFHEATTGPFQRSNTNFAPWAPGVENSDMHRDFMKNLEIKIKKFKTFIPKRRGKAKMKIT